MSSFVRRLVALAALATVGVAVVAAPAGALPTWDSIPGPYTGTITKAKSAFVWSGTPRYRLIGIRMPTNTECYGKQANAVLKTLVGQTFTAEHDAGGSALYNPSGYPFVYFTTNVHPDVSLYLISIGAAWTTGSTMPKTFSRAAEYLAAEQAAAAAGLGMWGACGGPPVRG